MQAYGQGGLKAQGLGHLERLARLYWYTVEFGLIATPAGLRIYGSGILSSAGELIYCLDDPRPHRIGFDLRRVMRTRYRIDRFQDTYFVIDDFDQLFDATRPDFTPIYQEVAVLPDCEPDQAARRGPGFCLQFARGGGPDKKMGRNRARPKFREETPRRRTVRPQPAIVTALHNLMRCAGMSSSFFEASGNVDSFGLDQIFTAHFDGASCASHKGRDFDGASKTACAAGAAAAARRARGIVSRCRRDLAGDRVSAGSRPRPVQSAVVAR